MSKILDLAVGESGHVTVVFKDAEGVVIPKPENTQYVVTPAGAADVVPDATGYVITRRQSVDYTVEVVSGEIHSNPLEDEFERPLAEIVQTVD